MGRLGEGCWSAPARAVVPAPRGLLDESARVAVRELADLQAALAELATLGDVEALLTAGEAGLAGVERGSMRSGSRH